MHLASTLQQSTHLSFGRATAQFQELVGLMAVISITIWSLVITTILARALLGAWHRRRMHIISNEELTLG
jgi:hypothetical protein